MVTRQDLFRSVSKKTKFKFGDVKKVCESLFKEIMVSSIENNNISIREFGNFQLIERKAKVGRDMKKGVPIEIPAKVVMKFIPCPKWEQGVIKLETRNIPKMTKVKDDEMLG